jgi:hypothetical protein
MNNFSNQLKSFLLLGLIIFGAACGSGDETPTPYSINFTNTALGISSSTVSTDVNITFSRAAEVAGSVDLTFNTGNLNYGSDKDFYTTPEMNSDVVTLSYEKGAESISFKVNAGSALNIQKDETITITLIDDNESFVLGQNTSLTITISENFIAASGIVELNGGGAEFPNQAFVDLSKLEQTTVNKYSWDLGFYAASGEHKVIINNSAYVMARAIDNSNIDEVTAADTTGFAADMVVSNYVNSAASGWIDHHNGDLSQTAFGNISVADADNKVFIIKRDGDNRSWKKVRVLQDGDNYTLQYADIASTTHTTVSVSKDAAYNHTFFDLDNGATAVEPVKDSWDIMYSTYANRANFGAILAVGYNDFIIINRNNVSTAMISTDDFSYDDFSQANLSTIMLASENISSIGSSWRDPFAGSVHADRFYIIQDEQQNTYKLKFTRFTSTSGERGYPEFSFELVK